MSIRLSRTTNRQQQRNELAQLALRPEYRRISYIRAWVRKNNDYDGCRARGGFWGRIRQLQTQFDAMFREEL